VLLSVLRQTPKSIVPKGLPSDCETKAGQIDVSERDTRICPGDRMNEQRARIGLENWQDQMPVIALLESE